MIETLNIEEGRPTIDEARRKLIDVIRSARERGVAALKIIHGYGSSGVGGALRPALRKSLSLRKKEGLVNCFAYGEKWSPFDPMSQAVLAACPALSGDRDLAQSNPGITIVVL
jgi:hypothetical protein